MFNNPNQTVDSLIPFVLIASCVATMASIPLSLLMLIAYREYPLFRALINKVFFLEDEDE